MDAVGGWLLIAYVSSLEREYWPRSRITLDVGGLEIYIFNCLKYNYIHRITIAMGLLMGMAVYDLSLLIYHSMVNIHQRFLARWASILFLTLVITNVHVATTCPLFCNMNPQETRDVYTMLVQCWPALHQHWVNAVSPVVYRRHQPMTSPC